MRLVAHKVFEHPRMIHLQRTTPCATTEAHSRRFYEEFVTPTQRDLTETDSPDCYFGARADHGGLSLRRYEHIGPAANIGSLVLCLPILSARFPFLASRIKQFKSLDIFDDSDAIDIEEAKAFATSAHQSDNHLFGWMCDAWIAVRNLGESSAIPPDPRLLLTGYYERLAKEQVSTRSFKIQRHISRALDHRDRKSLEQNCSTPADAARNTSNSNSASAAWTRAVPTEPCLVMNPHEFRTAHKIRCGQPLFPHDSFSKCKCGTKLSNAHALSCKHLRSRFIRHDSIVQDIFEWLRSQSIHAVKEFLPLPDSSARVDIWIRHRGVVYWCDVHIREPSNP
jgi:hypothetical protein